MDTKLKYPRGSDHLKYSILKWILKEKSLIVWTLRAKSPLPPQKIRDAIYSSGRSHCLRSAQKERTNATNIKCSSQKLKAPMFVVFLACEIL
jgi:hypothetical protein